MSDTLEGRYFGETRPLFWLYIRTTLLTLLTLGIYRFWAKTRLRKYIWSATTGGDDSFEYTGTGLEKLLGFLVAIVILAIYLGLIQLVLTFFGIFLFRDPVSDAEVLAQLAGVYLSLLAVVPLIFFAQYRARRYKMARTRWRGLRFGMESAAWGYVGRAILYNLLTICSLGILLPLQTFRLEKYMTDRTWYGDARFEQGGRWSALYAGMKHVAIGVIFFVGGVAIGAALAVPGLSVILVGVGYIWFLVGLVSYRVYAFNYMTSHKVLDGEVTFHARAKTSRVISIYVLGVLAVIGAVCAVVFTLFGIYLAMSDVSGVVLATDPDAALDAFATGMGVGIAIIVVVSYIALLLLLGALSFVLITQRLIEHFVTNLTAFSTLHLDTIRQRAADRGADADGFADALDIGGAI